MPLLLLLSLLASGAAAKTVPVELGKEFRLRKGEVAAVAGTKATLRIVKFINSPCPKGARCVWSGQAVYTELTVDGKVFDHKSKDWPYEVLVKDSDYATWALLVVYDPALCRKIDDERARARCIKELTP